MKTLFVILFLMTSCKEIKKETSNKYATKCFSSNGLSERYFLKVSQTKINLSHIKYSSSQCNPDTAKIIVYSSFVNGTYEFISSNIKSKEEYAYCGIQAHDRNTLKNIDGINCDLSWEYIHLIFSKTSSGYQVNDLSFKPFFN